MLRILRAFAWMRWRMLINSFEKTGSRDVLERFSMAAEKLGPIIAMILIVPSALMLAALAVGAGFAVARGNQDSLLFVALRYVLVFVPIAAIIGPLFLPSNDRTNPIRLLLLPIPRRTLYVAQLASALGEPWIVLMLPILGGIPLGLAAGGAFLAALVALVTGLLLLVVTVGIAALSTTLLHLMVRDRRRAELLGVIFIIVVSMAGLLPTFIGGSRERTADGKRVRPEAALMPWIEQHGRGVIALYPTELYYRGTREAATGRFVPAVGAAAGLGATALLIHLVGMWAFARVLDGPTSASGRRTGSERAVWGRTLPGLSPGASAVALAHLRLAIRTTRGRTSLISPLIMLVMFSALAYSRQGGMDFGSFQTMGGLALATFVSFISLVSMLPIAMNQFAVDGPGLTMVFLSPLSDRDLLAGKAVGNAFLSLPMAYFCALAVFVMFPGGSGALWLSIPIGLTATYFFVAPAAATFSAMFPRAADLSSIGNKGNAHGLAGLLGLVSFLVGGAPCILIVLLATQVLGRPWLAPVLLLLWCAVAFAISRLLFVAARRIFVTRRENLATLVSRVPSSS
jgi:hypothetical protein